jgi:hypothetical protein
MLFEALVYVVVAILSITAIEFVLDFFRLFGLQAHDYGLTILVFPMVGVAWVASHGRPHKVEWLADLLVVFMFLGALILIANYGNWLAVLLFVAAYPALYAKPFWHGCNYLFVRLPLEQEAVKQRTLTTKLDADLELADATLRYERARAALADAERAAEEAERRGRARQ